MRASVTCRGVPFGVCIPPNNDNTGIINKYTLYKKTKHFNDMKKVILFIAMLVAATTAVRGQISYGAPNDWFTTVWDMSKPTDRTIYNPASTIAIPIRGTNYTLYWEDVNQTTTNGIVNLSTPWAPYYLPVPSGTTKVRVKIYKGVGAITGFFEAAWNTDSKRLIAVEQWGTNVWTNLARAFNNYPNMDVTATDVPNLSACQDVSYMFAACTSLVNANGSISGWQTANVTNMSGMFYNATAFNQPIGNWQTANVTNMAYMFYGATAFNQPIGNWNTANVTTMESMFCEATAFNKPLNWNTANVTIMSGMFYGAFAFNQPIGNWNTSNVTSMSYMFAKLGWIVGNMSFNQDISGWNTANVTDMFNMFSNNISFNQPIGTWNTANVTNMQEMFSGATAFNKPLNWNTANVTNMSGMFAGATAFNQPLNWNTQSVTNMQKMFAGATSFNQPIGGWNTEMVGNMQGMFSGATAFNQDLSGWDVSKVADMSYMFSGATAFNGNVNGWGNKMKNVTDIRWMFQGARAFNQSLENWVLNSSLSRSNTEKILFGSGMQCPNITATLNGWAKNSEFNPASVGKTIEIDFTGVVYSRTARDIMRYLRQNKGINILEIGYYAQDCDGINFDQYTIKVDTRRDATGAATPTNRAININVVGTNFSVTYTDVSNPWNTGTVAGLNTGDAITLPSAGTYKISVFVPTGSASSSITKLSTTEAPLSNGYIIDVVNWSNIKWQSLKDAFKGCTGLAHLSAADIPNLSECTSLEAMFQNCTGLTVVPSVEDWNLSNVTSLKSMFAGATAFNQHLNRLNVSNISDFSGMFSGATAFDHSLGEWNLGGVTDGNTAMLNMFDNSGISCASYKETLTGWSMRSSTPNNIRLGAANVNYGDGAATIRTNLQTNKSWTFVGDLLSAGCDGADASGRYITVWDTRIPTTRTIGSPLDIATNICGNNVTIYWEEVGNTSNNGTLTGLSGTLSNPLMVTGLPHAGVYRLKATIGNDPSLSMNYGDAGRLIYLEQWGNAAWKSLGGAFFKARNMKVLATDIPNLTQLSDLNPYPYHAPMVNMFIECSSLTMVPSINSWSMPSGVKSISYMFQGATSFNQDLSGWDVSHITDMSNMFQGATSFNSPLLWGSKVSNVTNMSYMFQGATSFNQDITGWDVSSVTDMSNMFQGATSFNQPIGLWGSKTANVANYSFMFQEASSFDQNLGTWTMKSGCYGDIMFERSGMGCENYSATFVGWAAQTAFIPTGHFYAGQNCLLPLNAAGMAAHKELVRRGAYDMDVHYLAPDCKEDFYETTWSVPNTNTNRDTLTINAIGTNFTVVWEVIDSTQYPPRYEAGFDTAANASPRHPYTLRRNAWNKANVPGTVKVKVFAGNGTLTGLYMPGADPIKLVSVDHWGNNKWQRLDSAFFWAERMELKATDAPDLSEVTGSSGLDGMFELCGNMSDVHDKIGTWDVSKIKSMKAMFKTAVRFNRNINSWNVSAVTNMSGMFDNAYSFNQPLADWNVSNVTDMSSMFIRAAKFNQPIGGWNVSKVTNMSSMFARTDAFNQPIGGWNVGAVTNMSGMFDDAKAFNKPLNDWNVSKVTNMNLMFNTAIAFNQPLDRWDVRKATSMGAMFYGATAFDQPLGKWKPFSSTMMGEMFGNSGMSCANYSGTLYGWAQNVDSLKPNVLMTLQHNMKYNRRGKYARNKITTTKNWTFGQDTEDLTCGLGMPFPTDYVSEWDMSKTGAHPSELVTNLWGTNFVVEWLNLNDGTTGAAVATATTVPYTITGLTAGKRYRVIAYADPSNPSSTLSKLSTMVGGGYSADAKRLDSVTQWGANRWTSLTEAFRGCSRMDVTATDVPDLRGVNDLSSMFYGCDSLVYNPTINTWRTNSITNMYAMFWGAKAFNQPIGSWNTDSVINMALMFVGTEAFNQDISGWNTAKVENMGGMFEGATSFNQPIGNWNTAKVRDMGGMFREAEAFNQPLNNWNTANVFNMTGMFANTKAFNQPIGNWNVEGVQRIAGMFRNAEAFDQDLSSWNLISVINIDTIFKAPLNKGMSCSNYSKTLQGWANNPLTKTGLNFIGQLNRNYNIIGKESRDILTKAVAQGGKGWTISGDTYDQYCGSYMWTGAVSTDITDHANWQGGRRAESSPILGEFKETVAFDSLAVHDMHIPSLPYTPPGSDPNVISFYSFGNFINKSNKKLVIEPNGHLYIGGLVLGSDSASKADKIVVKADDTRPNGTLILAGQPCDKPVYATVEMYSKASKSASPLSWTDNIPGSPTHGQSISSSYKWQYIGIPVEGEIVNAFYGSYVRKYDETLNSTDHFYGKWRKLGADETWQPLVPFAGYEVTSRTPKVYVFKGRLLHCPQELTLTRQAAEVTAYTGTDIHKKYYGLGQNLFGNSYTAALRIGDGRLSDAIGSKPIEKTVYIYNTGSIADWNGGSTLTGDGSFLAVPANIAGSPELSAEYISSMQGFLLKFRNDALTGNTGAPEKITIGLRNGGVEPFGGNQRPQRAPQADPIHGFLKVGLTSRRSVSSISLIEAEGTTDEFDNGWDGMQLNTGRSSSATLFVPSEYGDLQVSTSDNIVGDRFGIVNNGDTAYRLTVIRHRLDNRGDLYLYDVATNRYTLLDADTTVYDFTSEGSGNVDKRFVITDRRNADDPNTAVEEAAEDMSLYGYVDGRHTLVVNNHTAEAGMLTLLDVSGKVVYTSPFGVGFSRHDLSHLPAGVYIARLEASVRRATVKAITMK